MSGAAFISKRLVAERAAPVRTTGVAGFVRARLLNSPGNILLTAVSILLLWFSIVPTLKFLVIDAVWQGRDRDACLAENVGRAVGACWPFVQAKFSQFIYGFYPQPERWRVNLTFLLAALLLLPLLIPKLPAKSLNAGLFFIAFPVVAFFLLYGGGIKGFGIAWSEAALAALANGLVEGGRKLAGATALPLLSSLALALGALIEWTGYALAIVLWPLTFLKKHIQTSGQPVWADFLATTLIVSGLLFFLSGGFRNGWRALIASLTTFAGIAMVIAILRLDRGGLPIVDTRVWGGLLVTLVVSVTYLLVNLAVDLSYALLDPRVRR